MEVVYVEQVVSMLDMVKDVEEVEAADSLVDLARDGPWIM